jgi:peptidoglycan/LPS O-acetylase OafA/YrhL
VAVRYLYPRLTPWAVLGIAVGVILVLSYLVHRLVERPSRSWLDRRLRDSVAKLRETPERPADEPGTPDADDAASHDPNPPREMSPTAP